MLPPALVHAIIAAMKSQLPFANNNDDNDDPRIVGRSLAG
jgi:hypothetical protein